MSFGFGKSAWVRIVHGTRWRATSAAACIARQLVNRASARPCDASIRRDQLVVHGWFVIRRPWIRKVNGTVQQRLVLVGKGATHVQLVVTAIRKAKTLAQVRGNGGARKHSRRGVF